MAGLPENERAGAKVLATATQVFATADLIVKVKEPQPAECAIAAALGVEAADPRQLLAR